jgi:hypothetical protein
VITIYSEPNSTPTFGLSAAGAAAIADLPGVNRVFVTFTDANVCCAARPGHAIRTQ